jgi:hypothetical protein
MPQNPEQTTSGPLMGFSDPFSDSGNGIRHAASCEVRELPGLPHPAPSPLDVSHVPRGLHLRSFCSLVSCCAAHGISITGSGRMFSPSRSEERQSRILADQAQGKRHTTRRQGARSHHRRSEGEPHPGTPRRRKPSPQGGATHEHLVVPTFIAGEPTAKEGHKEGQLSEHTHAFKGHNLHRRTRTSCTSLLPKRIQQKRCPCRLELDPKASLPTPVLNQPRRTRRGHVTGMPSPSDAGPPK